MKLASEKYRLRKMAKLASGYAVIIDVGCSDMPNPYLVGKELIGFDLEKPTMTLPRNYSRFIQGDVFDLSDYFEKGAIHCIVLGEVLEHVERPLDLLRAAREVLSPGGRLILSTPNPNSFIERLLTLNLSRKYFYTNEHIVLYPQRWLIRLLEISGFTTVTLKSGGMLLPGFDLMPFPRPWCYQTIAIADV